jgi:BirA family biotin operon repressor/biotin-[acetyl-CoA-carboxylase] ligase
VTARGDAAGSGDGDLTREAVDQALPGRPTRVYPALLSTEAEATAWARAGAPDGAVVVADYQVSARGRAGLPLTSRLGEGLGFSIVLRPDLPIDREGWPYLVGSLAVAGGLDQGLDDEPTRVCWPDRVTSGDGTHLADLGLQVGLSQDTVAWAVLTVLVATAHPPRPPLLARLVEALEHHGQQSAEGTLEEYRRRCSSLGCWLRALMVPLGPGGPEVTGEAVDVLPDGALVLRTRQGNRVAIPPMSLGLLEDAVR